MDSIEQVREKFKSDRFATDCGCEIDEIGDKYAKCHLALCDMHKNAMGNLMGGVSFTLADFAFAIASNWQGTPTVSLCSNITFLGKAKGDVIFAEAKCKKDGRTACYYEISVTDNLDNKIAEVTINGFHV